MQELSIPANFPRRHIGISDADRDHMLRELGVTTIDDLIRETVPQGIRRPDEMDLPERVSEAAFIKEMREIASTNKTFRSFIGQGYYGTIVPAPIQRNIFENPGWYTQYTPYQAEIAQGRLEALLNFQTVITELTGLPLANASLLDEGTAAAEAMQMLRARLPKNEAHRNVFLISKAVFPQTKNVIECRAIPTGITLQEFDPEQPEFPENAFGLLLQYPDNFGEVSDYRELVDAAAQAGIRTCVAADILSLTVLAPPSSWGADVVVGSTQRFGVPMGFGGPHAAFMSATEDYKRLMPGRIIGVSVDADGNRALRMALQTREQHIRREKATSNVCTAQALLAIMAGMYAVYHGPQGLRDIAERVHRQAAALEAHVVGLGYEQRNRHYFDTLRIKHDEIPLHVLRQAAERRQINLRYYSDGSIGVSLDETVERQDLQQIADVFSEALQRDMSEITAIVPTRRVPDSLVREVDYLTHEVFNRYRSETELMRYIKRLENRDLSLMHSMIPLGSCTMKLNAATQLMPVSWPAFANLHPFVPLDQAKGYTRIIHHLEQLLGEITGLPACSLQPNSGAQGEFAGLMVIQAYHRDRGEAHRNVALIPSSAHGTNPASAVMAGMEVVVVQCDDNGNIDLTDLEAKASTYSDRLGGIMVTYPSTHGVFEEGVMRLCDIIHEHGGLVYMDGANMNAQVGLTSPGFIGADVCHLNLHKTFSIPHGGGGPGMGPICVREDLRPYLPSHVILHEEGAKHLPAVNAAPFGSASILLISYAYIRLLGREGCREATEMAILNANYIAHRLQGAYDILYSGQHGRVAHELIVDCRPFKKAGIEIDDVAKRLIDYGFHAPTMSFPVPGTLMIEPTESESLEELDRFCEAMLQIRQEIRMVEEGTVAAADSVLRHAPFTFVVAVSDDWPYAFTRQAAVTPLPWVAERKFWPRVRRVNNPYGDRNLICTCPPIEAYEAAEA